MSFAPEDSPTNINNIQANNLDVSTPHEEQHCNKDVAINCIDSKEDDVNIICGQQQEEATAINNSFLSFDTRSAAESTLSDPVVEEVPPERFAEEAKAYTDQLSWALCLTMFLTSAAQNTSATAVSFYVIFDLSFGTVEYTHFWMYMGWASWVSPLIGCFSDGLAFTNDRRRPCIAFGAIGNAIIWALIYYVPSLSVTYWKFVLLILTQTVLQMFISVPQNALTVEMNTILPPNIDDQFRTFIVSRLQSKAMFFRNAGSLGSSVLNTVLLLYIDYRHLIGVSVILYLLILVPLVFVNPTRRTAESPYSAGFVGILKKWEKLILAIRKSCASGYKGDVVQFICVLLFTLVYCSMPDSTGTYFMYVGRAFWFKPWFLSMNQAIGLLGSVFSAVVYAGWVTKETMPTKINNNQNEHEDALLNPDEEESVYKRGGSNAFRIFAMGCVCSSLGYVTNLMVATGFSTHTMGISPEVFIPIDNFYTTFMSRLAFMPVLQVAAERAPPGFEGFVFELFTTASLGGSSIAALSTAQLLKDFNITKTMWDNLWMLLLTCAVCKLLPIVLAALLPRARSAKKTTETDESSPITS